MRRWRILTVGNTSLCLHPAMPALALYSLLTGHVRLFLTSLLSILLHEGAHAFTSYLLGRVPERIEITPLGAVMRIEDERRLPSGKRIMILLAGPLMTLVLCVAAVRFTSAGLTSAATGYMLFRCNLAILMINLLPAFPLDGGRLLLLLLERVLSARFAGRVVRIVGYMIGIGLILLNILVSAKAGGWNLSLALVGCCLIYCASSAAMTSAMEELRLLMNRKIRLEEKGSLPTKLITAVHTQTMRQLIQCLPDQQAAFFMCLEAGSLRLMGWASERIIICTYLENPNKRLAEVIQVCKDWGKTNKKDTI